MADDIPDWTQAVTVSGGSVTVKGGDVNVVNTPSVTVSSGTVDVGNTPAVTISSGSVDIGAGTVSVQNVTGTVIQTGDTLALLVSTVAQPTGSATWLATIAAADIPFPVSSLVVRVSGTGAVAPYCVLAKASSNAVAVFIAPFGAQGTSGYLAFLPIAISPGDGLILEVSFPAATGGKLSVSGTTAGLGVQLRPDGRTYPLGARQASGVYLSTGTTALLPALAAPLRYLITSAQVRGLATANAIVDATTFPDICSIDAPVLQVTAPIPPQGLLLPPGKPLNVTRTNTRGVRATVTYDVVV